MLLCSNNYSTFSVHQTKCTPNRNEYLQFEVNCRHPVDYVTINFMIRAQLLKIHDCVNLPEIISRATHDDQRVIQYFFGTDTSKDNIS